MMEFGVVQLREQEKEEEEEEVEEEVKQFREVVAKTTTTATTSTTTQQIERKFTRRCYNTTKLEFHWQCVICVWSNVPLSFQETKNGKNLRSYALQVQDMKHKEEPREVQAVQE